MNKSDLVAIIANEADITNDKANTALTAILNEITLCLSRKESVSLVGFGTFENRHRNARTGINPQTGAALQIPATNTVGFKPGKALKNALN